MQRKPFKARLFGRRREVDYRTFRDAGSSEVIEKKSRFIGEAVRVASAAEAEAYIAGVRKHYYDARHHCFAFIAGEPGTPGEIRRSGDDGEPSGTAGRPILEILEGRSLHNVLIVVTRYFGGTLLGTGGLARAYSAAAREAAEDAGTVTVRDGVRMRISCSYGAYGKFQYQFAQDGVQIADAQFSDNVVMEIVVPPAEEDRIRKLTAELTDGGGQCETLQSVRYEQPD